MKTSLIHGNIFKSILSFAWPVLGALFLQALYGAVDLVVVGKFSSTAELSGVASGSMFSHTLAMVITAFAIGITVLVGEAIGAGQRKQGGDVIGTGVIFFAIIAIALTLVVVPLSPQLAELMKAPEEAFEQTTSYIRICGFGIIFIVAYNLLAAIFRGLGDSKTPLITVIIATLVNVIGDVFFVVVLELGAKGAAFATILAQAISVIVSLIFVLKRKDTSITKDSFRLRGRITLKIFTVGAPVALHEFLVGISFMFIQATANSISLIASDAVGISEKVIAFLMLVASSFMQTMAAFAAQNNGAKRHDRAKKGLGVGMIMALVAGIATCMLAVFAGDFLISIFSSDVDVIEAGFSYIKAYSIDCICTAILFCFMGYFNGNEHTMFVLVQGIIGAFFLRIPLVMLFNNLTNGDLFVIGLATPSATIVQIGICTVAYFVFEKQLGKIQT